MKPLSLNLSKMKKIAGDSHSSTFLHPTGHKMVIAHSGVSALQRKQLEKMPVHKYAEGSGVIDEGDQIAEDAKKAPVRPEYAQFLQQEQAKSNPQMDAVYGTPEERAQKDLNKLDANASGNAAYTAQQNKIQDLVNANRSGRGAAPVALPGANNMDVTPGPLTASLDRVQDSVPSSPELKNSPDVAATPSPYSADPFSAYQQGQQAITEQQKVDSAKAQADVGIQKNDLEARQSLNQDIQKNFGLFAQHQQQAINDYMAGHIDPKHYVDNMGTGEKIATSIGLLLGGFSSAFTHQGNPAMDYLNKQIDRDIASQQNRQDQQRTLLGANQALFHDQQVAQNQTRVNLNDIYDHQIQLAAAKLGTPQAKAIADAAHAKFALENNQLLNQSAMRAAVMNRLQNGGGGINAIDLSNAGMIPHEEAVKEQGSIDSQNKALASAKDIFDKYRKEQTSGNLLNPQSYKRADELNAQLTNLIMESDASKRLTPESAKLEVKPFWVRTSDDEKTINDKLSGIANLVRQHAAPTPYMSHYSPSSLPQYGQAASHPMEGKTASDSKGNRIVMKNGRWVPYGG